MAALRLLLPLAFFFLSSVGVEAVVGPDLKARARLLRDLPLMGHSRKGRQQQGPRRTLIDVSLAVRSLDLDWDKGVLKTDGWMSLRWTDPRYSWDPRDYDGARSVTLPFSKVWAPELILHNSVQEKFIFRQVGMVKHAGEFVYLVAIHSLSACEPNFEEFPFGMQDCRLAFGSWVNEGYNVEYRIAPNETAVALEEFSSPTGWKMVAADARLESKQYPLFEEPSHTVVFDFAFKRDKYFDKETGRLITEGSPEWQQWRRRRLRPGATAAAGTAAGQRVDF